ncbi:hsp90 co-chaperone Cdc37, partial [Coelomomyces lativittatus]
MSKIDYSRWNNIELSDDEDIEGHPNVDKKSLIRWRQQKIHQEREDRRQGIISTRAQLEWLDEYMDLLKHYPSPTQEIETTVQAHLKKFENIPKEILIQNVHEKTPEAFDSFRKTVIEHRASVQKEHDRLVTEENEKLTVDNICKPGFDSKT